MPRHDVYTLCSAYGEIHNLVSGLTIAEDFEARIVRDVSGVNVPQRIVAAVERSCCPVTALTVDEQDSEALFLLRCRD